MTERISPPLALLPVAFAFAVLFDGNPAYTFACLVLLVAQALWLAWPTLSGQTFIWSRVHWVLLAYIVWQSMLVPLSSVPENTFLMYGIWLSLVIVCFATAGLSAAGWRRMLSFFLVAGIVTALWGIAEGVVTGIRANGPIVDPNAWATVNNLFFFMLFAVYLTVPQLRRVALCGLAIFAAAVFASYSRTGLVVFAAGLSLVTLLAWRIAEHRRPLLQLAAAVAAVYLLLNLPVHNAIVSYAPFTLDGESGGWVERFSMWKAALLIAADHPLTGVGPGTYNLHYPQYQEVVELGTYGYFAHNDYMQFLAEGGPLLFLFLLAFTLFLIVELYRAGAAVFGGDKTQIEPLLLVVGMGAVLAQCLMNFPLYLLQIHMLLGLALARLLSVRQYLYRTQFLLLAPGFSRVLASLTAFMLISVATLDGIGFDVNFMRSVPVLKEVRDNPAVYYQVSYWLRLLRSGNARNRLAMAEIYIAGARAQSAPKLHDALQLAGALEYAAALQRNPYLTDARIKLAQLLEAHPEMLAQSDINKTPLQLYQAGVALAPTQVPLHLVYFAYLERQGKADLAYEVLTGNALKWSNLQREYYLTVQDRVALLVLQRATARGDVAALEKLLETVGPAVVDKAIKRNVDSAVAAGAA